MYLYHQHLLPFLPTKSLSMLWVNLIRTFKNWETVKGKYPHKYSFEKIWAYALLVQAELTVRGKAPNPEYLKTSNLGGNLCSPYFENKILYRNAVEFALRREVIFLDHNNGYLITSLNKLIGKKLIPHNYGEDWVTWNEKYEKGAFKAALCNGDYYGILKQPFKYTVGDTDFLK